MKRVCPLLLIPMLILPVHGMAQYRIPHGTFGCGGGVRSGTDYIYDTAGQPAAEVLSGDGYYLKLGFWYIAGLESAVESAILSFEARYSGDAVRLSWRTGVDGPFDGYDVYRAEGDTERFARINSERLEPLDEAEFTDAAAFPGRSYSYYISAVRDEAELFRSAEVKVALPPRDVTLYQNFPNPFNPSTTISFFIPERSEVRLDIYDTAGKKVRTLADGVYPAARYDLEWNGRDVRNEPVSSGIYFYRLSAGRKTITRKLVLIR